MKGKPDMMVALNLLCDEEGPAKAIWNAQGRYRKKPGKEHSRWYPVGSCKPSKGKGEGAEMTEEMTTPEIKVLNNDGPNIVVPDESKPHLISSIFFNSAI